MNTLDPSDTRLLWLVFVALVAAVALYPLARWVVGLGMPAGDEAAARMAIRRRYCRGLRVPAPRREPHPSTGWWAGGDDDTARVILVPPTAGPHWHRGPAPTGPEPRRGAA